MQLVLFLAITAIVSFFLGGFNGAIITSLSFFRKDVRKFGSGNAGLTNFTRSFGTNGLPLVILIDVLKTLAAVFFGRWLLGFEGYPVIGVLFAGFCTMLGHIYPVFYGLRGGKAILCGGVLVWMIDWRVGLICWSVFIIVVVFSKYVSLGSIIGSLFLPATVWVFGYQNLDIILASLCTLLVIFAHRENIVRLIGGTENKLSIGGSSGTG